MLKQPDDEIWSGNRTVEIFFLKNYAKNEAWKLVPDLFCF